MAVPQEVFKKIIIRDTPKFADDIHASVNDWIRVVNLSVSDLELHDPQQEPKGAPQYLAGEALKWYLSQQLRPNTWNDLNYEIILQYLQKI
ncbi:unnamed protein product [Didymodactylos carnosus]|uniref:Uncharacterized protein n=1 Tax=Didymodactylos carnosus TaxID=1234261 RepID=A0A814MZ64_9BILA|nr:unnamed protein product [Didymodactylos carnosus]CAF3850854.1 unnamed protein product [Didymodactylos carnosus]